ncbi:MAG TPA: putative toxin-antitoxin system toxin component, PIN family [Verrucomicrobiae bacterium]
MHKPRAVLDSSVVVAGIGWGGGDARKVLKLLAVGGFESWRTSALTAEWGDTVQRIAETEKRWRNANWVNWIAWLKAVSKLTPDVPLKKTVSRDPKDDAVIMAALVTRAEYLVSYDPDILVLGKPYGVVCLTPRALLSAILRDH